MPRTVAIAKYTLVAWFLFLAVISARRALSIRSWMDLDYLLVVLLPLAASVALIRNLRWGCRFSVGLQLVTVILLAVLTIPGPGSPHPLGTAFYQLPLWLQQLLYVGGCAALLLPLVPLSRHANLFRSGVW